MVMWAAAGYCIQLAGMGLDAPPRAAAGALPVQCFCCIAAAAALIGRAVFQQLTDKLLNHEKHLLLPAADSLRLSAINLLNPSRLGSRLR